MKLDGTMHSTDSRHWSKSNFEEETSDYDDYNGCFHHGHSRLTMHLGLTLPRYKKKREYGNSMTRCQIKFFRKFLEINQSQNSVLSW